MSVPEGTSFVVSVERAAGDTWGFGVKMDQGTETLMVDEIEGGAAVSPDARGGEGREDGLLAPMGALRVAETEGGGGGPREIRSMAFIGTWRRRSVPGCGGDYCICPGDIRAGASPPC